MHRATPSASSTASSSSSRSRRLRISREQLEKSLQVLGRPTAPLPVELPPSPPASRSSSPAPSHKRKPEPDTQPGPSKRPRTSSVSDGRRQAGSSSAHRPPPVPAHRRSDPPSEDGELHEDVPAPRDAVVYSNIPVRRPRRGPLANLPKSYFAGLHSKYYNSARALKFSGDARTLATYRPSTPSYRPLSHPPPPNSSYHKYGSIIARLELLEAVIHFAYANWAKEIEIRRQDPKADLRGLWGTLQPFMIHCRKRWEMDATDDREKALLGVVCMVEGFVYGTSVRDTVWEVDQSNLRALESLRERYENEIKAKAAKANENPMATPPMLPSPASITSSTTSTPTTKHEEEPKPAPPRSAAPKTEVVVPPHITFQLNYGQVKHRRFHSEMIYGVQWATARSQEYLSLPVLMKHFPRTFTRVMHSTFSARDEHEPDIEDEEGELFWPGQALAGGLAWACALGKAMVKEFGKEFGYRGVEGVVPKDESFQSDSPDDPDR